MRLHIIILLGLLLQVAGCWTDDPTRHNTFTPITSIKVTPAYEFMADKTVNQYRAVGDFSGSYTRDITSEVTWIIEDDAIATVSNDTGTEGLVSALSPGETTITAVYGDVSQDWPVVVTNAFLTGIGITPQDAELQAGITLQYEAAGTFSDDSVQDITILTTWESSDTDVATIDSKGRLKTLNAGISTITGSWQGIEANTSLLVTDALLTSISLTPDEATIAQGTTVQFEAEGKYSDGTTQDITKQVGWQSADEAIAIIGSAGLAEGIAPGEAEISASFDVGDDTLSTTAVLTVTNAFIVTISLEPANSTIQVGASQQFAAIGRFSDNSEQDITGLVTWSSSNNSVGTISNSSDSRGLFISSNTGSTLIEAIFGGFHGNGGVTGQTLLTVQ